MDQAGRQVDHDRTGGVRGLLLQNILDYTVDKGIDARKLEAAGFGIGFQLNAGPQNGQVDRVDYLAHLRDRLVEQSALTHEPVDGSDDVIHRSGQHAAEVPNERALYVELQVGEHVLGFDILDGHAVLLSASANGADLDRCVAQNRVHDLLGEDLTEQVAEVEGGRLEARRVLDGTQIQRAVLIDEAGGREGVRLSWRLAVAGDRPEPAQREESTVLTVSDERNIDLTEIDVDRLKKLEIETVGVGDGARILAQRARAANKAETEALQPKGVTVTRGVRCGGHAVGLGDRRAHADKGEGRGPRRNSPERSFPLSAETRTGIY